MHKFLNVSKIIDYTNPLVSGKAMELRNGCLDECEIVRNCFLYVRDEIRHSGDHKENITVISASDVLKHKTGWCYAKAHLLAALLRANAIPAGLCYQRLFCGEYKVDGYCLHGLNAVFLKKYGWYRVDARGNKEGVDAAFNPPKEQLAFVLQKGEKELSTIYDEPLKVVVDALKTNNTYLKMIMNFPDINGGGI